MRFILCFFKTRITDTSDIFSITPSRTILSAIICSVQCFLPFGAVLQAVAIMWASTLPVIFPGTGGVSLFLRCNTRSMPWVWYCFLIL